MRRTISRLALFVATAAVLVPLAVGCSTTESENVKTSGIWARFEVDHYWDGEVICWGVLRVGGQSGTMVDLSGGEFLDCNGVLMDEYVEPVTDYRWTRAEVAEDPEGIYEFYFDRMNDADVSTIVEVAPAPFIDELVPSDVVYGGEALSVYWDPTYPGDDIDIDVDGSCIENLDAVGVPDDGEYTFDAVVVDPNVGGDCELEIIVTRNIHGSVNPAYQGGFTASHRIESTTIPFEELAPR
jgi:hypothetical protein